MGVVEHCDGGTSRCCEREDWNNILLVRMQHHSVTLACQDAEEAGAHSK